MATPITWDSTVITWDLPGARYDADYIDPSTFQPDPRRTVKVKGESFARLEFAKDPDAKLDYTWDWSGWLAPGDQLKTGSFTFPSVITAAAISISDTNATMWISGGAGASPNAPVKVQCRVETTQGRIEDRTLFLRIEDR